VWYGQGDLDALTRLQTPATRAFERSHPAERAEMRQIARDNARTHRPTAAIVAVGIRGTEGCVKMDGEIGPPGDRERDVSYGRWRFENGDWYLEGLPHGEELRDHCQP
jgi:hypothetical protein